MGRVFGDVFSVDSRMGRTVRPFLLRPGFLTREFNEGRRTRYSAPFRLYLLASLALFLSFDVQRRAAAWDETMNAGESSAATTPEEEPAAEPDEGAAERNRVDVESGAEEVAEAAGAAGAEGRDSISTRPVGVVFSPVRAEGYR